MIHSLQATIVSLFVRTFSTRGKESCTESQRSGVAVGTGEYAVDTTARSSQWQWSQVETVVTMTRQTRNCGHYEMVLRQDSAPVVHYRLNINYQMLPYLALSEDPSAFGGFLLGMEPSFVL